MRSELYSSTKWHLRSVTGPNCVALYIAWIANWEAWWPRSRCCMQRGQHYQIICWLLRSDLHVSYWEKRWHNIWVKHRTGCIAGLIHFLKIPSERLWTCLCLVLPCIWLAGSLCSSLRHSHQHSKWSSTCKSSTWIHFKFLGPGGNIICWGESCLCADYDKAWSLPEFAQFRRVSPLLLIVKDVFKGILHEDRYGILQRSQSVLELDYRFSKKQGRWRHGPEISAQLGPRKTIAYEAHRRVLVARNEVIIIMSHFMLWSTVFCRMSSI